MSLADSEVSAPKEKESVLKSKKNETTPKPLPSRPRSRFLLAKSLMPKEKSKALAVFEWNGKNYSTNQADDAPRSDDFFVKRAQQRNKETAPSDDYKPSGYKKGGKVKGDKKKVMGTVGEAKALMNAMKKVRRPATPMPGARMAGLGMAPPMAPQMMAPPMKRGGKVMKKAAGGSTKRHTNSKGV
jgi:hypothetical protein